MRAHHEILARELFAGDPSAAPEEVLTREEVRTRMEAAFADCVRRGLPVSVLFVEVTRMERKAREVGVQPTAVRRAVVEILRHDARSGDLFACEEDEGILVMLSSTELETAELVCRQAVDDAKKLSVEGLERPVRASLGIGLAGTSGRGALLFETLALVAGEGAAVAKQRGGECFVHTMLYEVMQKRAEKLALAAGKNTAPPVREEAGAAESAPRKIPEVHAAAAVPSAQARPAEAGGAAAHAPPADEETDILRRRINKLTRALEKSEQTLAEVCALKGVAPGIASTYREVQGLAAAEPERECKQMLLKQIFAANLELQHLRQARADALEVPARADRVALPEPELVPAGQ